MTGRADRAGAAAAGERGRPVAQRRPRLLEAATIGGLLLFYLAVSLHHLDTVPPLYGDESWESSVAWTFATQGRFASAMFTGCRGMEERYYQFMPLHALFLAAGFRAFGLGLWQARLVSVAMGAAVLILTYTLGRRLFGWRVGALAAAFLVLVRLAGTTRTLATGIPLIDVGRMARYDVVVAVFGLAALHVYLSARARAAPLGYLAAGALAGVAGLAHLYGLFWIAALAVLARLDGAGLRRIAMLAAGAALAWLPYAAFVLAAPLDWLGQLRLHARRFGVFDPGWYWTNLREEVRRYGPGLGPPGWSYLARPGFWVTLVLLPASGLALARRALADGDGAARAVVVPALALGILFAVLLHVKVMNYAITIWPLAAIVLAWGALSLWDRSARRAGRAVLLAVLVAVLAEGVSRFRLLSSMGAAATRPDRFAARVRTHVPDGVRVLGGHEWWFGFHDLDYRSWVVPLWKSNPELFSPPHAMDAVLDDIDPEVILLDAGMEGVLAGWPAGPAVYDWMRANGWREVAAVSDPTYGTMRIYRRPPR